MRQPTFYRNALPKFIPDKEASILVVGGHHNDYAVMEACGFTNVTISNLSEFGRKADSDYAYDIQDAEALTYEDNSFDYVVTHASLHHCRSPHRGLIEMYRVARKGAIFFESRDSLVMRLVVSFGLSAEYETSAVMRSGFDKGGVSNSPVPNYVYRWTEREVEKTINTFDPCAPHEFVYAYERAVTIRRGLRGLLTRVFKLVYVPLTMVFPGQCNLFACMVKKPDVSKHHFPWLNYDQGEFSYNREWTKVHNRAEPVRQRVKV
ncbi:MAG: class I SAM-dependent methyltransferase [Opitutales bacterium]